jgi:hypothetical protein
MNSGITTRILTHLSIFFCEMTPIVLPLVHKRQAVKGRIYPDAHNYLQKIKY